jgi:hypothetical protein
MRQPYHGQAIAETRAVKQLRRCRGKSSLVW